MRFRKQEELPPTFDFDPYRAAFVSTVWLIYTTALVRFALLLPRAAGRNGRRGRQLVVHHRTDGDRGPAAVFGCCLKACKHFGMVQ